MKQANNIVTKEILYCMYMCMYIDVYMYIYFTCLPPFHDFIFVLVLVAYEEVCSLRPQIEGAQFKVQLVLICSVYLCVINTCIFVIVQLRETHESEQEKAYHLKAQVIEVTSINTYNQRSCTCFVASFF